MPDAAAWTEPVDTTWNDTGTAVPAGHIHELVEQAARRTPGAMAVAAAGSQLTYAELNESANRFASYISAFGVGESRPLAVCLERSAESLIAQLGAFKLGAAAVLIDPAYPTHRIQFMLADSAPAAVVTRAALRGRLGTAGRTVCSIDTDAERWRACSPRNPRRPVTDDTICHIAYTSGSTGVPKGVLFRHGAVRNTAHVLRTQCGITPGCGGSWLCSPGFGLVEVDCFPLLSAGATVHIPEPDVAASPRRLMNWLVDRGITQALVLTAMAERLWALDWPTRTRLRWMRVAGEPLRNWPPPALPFRVLNVYGSAEATVVATCDLTALGARLGASGRAERRPPVGRPVANVRAYVLDDRMTPAPPGDTGELYVSGVSLSAGYLGRPGASAEKFLPNSLPGDPHPVVYRSGDVATRWPDGTIEVIGRADNEIKIRGYRVHLGEIESALAQLPDVRQCCVLAREDRAGHQRLVAYIEPANGARPRVSALRQALAERLPEFMVPAAYVVGAFPVTANGKIDRAALPEPPQHRPDIDTPYLAPRDRVETALAELWSRTLDIDAVGVLDSFFELGGDSLRAVRLADAVHESLGVELSLEEFYRHPTVADSARLVADGRPEPTERP